MRIASRLVKRSSPQSPSFAPFFRKIFLLRKFEKSGAALLIALCFLVLLSAVVLALFSTASTGRRNATTFATGQETMRLADAAVNLVQGQIRDATIQPRVGWASQPGMVRAFDTAGTVTAYKLYSSDAMVVPNYGKTQIDAEFTQIQSWNSGATGKSFNALYTDLNAPAVVKRPDPANPTQNIDTPVFPIADPAAIGAVEGFSATTTVAGTTLGNGTTRRLPMPVKWIYVLKDGQMTAPSGGTATRATFGNGTVPTEANPIVGRIAFWADDDTCKLNINTASEGTFWDVPKATTWSEVRMAVSMPVQGEFQRMVGHPATTSLSPVFSSLSANYQRPASLIDSSSIASVVSNPDSYFAPLANYYSLTPRINGSTGSTDNSSKGGAQRTAATGDPWAGSAPYSERLNASVWPVSDQAPNRKGSPLNPDADRLYSTSDEILFRPDRTLNLDLTAREVSKRDFFLTSASRSAETTLLGTPRIALWPQQTGNADRTIKDRLLNFCSTVGNSTYSFVRGIGTGGLYTGNQPADSPTADVSLARNQDLIAFLRKLSSTNLPGYGGSFASKWSSIGADKVIAQTFDVVRASINTDYVSMGGTTYRYGVTTTNPRSQVAPGSSNLYEDQSSGPRNYVIPARLSSEARGPGRTISITQFAVVFMASKIQNTVLVEWEDDPAPPAMPAVPNESHTQISDGETATPLPTKPGYVIKKTTITDQQTLEVRAFLLFQPYLATQGTPSVAPGAELEILGLNGMSVGGVPFASSNSLSTRFGSLHWQGNRETDMSGALGAFQLFGSYPINRTGNKSSGGYPQETYFKEAKNGGTDKDTDYPFVSPPIPVAGSTISFSGGSITAILKSWRNAEEYQRFSVTFPPASFVVPQHIKTDTLFDVASVQGVTYPLSGPVSINNASNGSFLSVRKRLIGNSNSQRNLANVIRPGDVVCAVEWSPTNSSSRGDFRVLALSPTVSDFTPVAGYGTASAGFPGTTKNNTTPLVGRFAHSLRTEAASVTQYDYSYQYGWVRDNTNLGLRNSLDTIGSTGTLVPGVSFTTHAAPIIPAGLTGATMSNGNLGDWQSGIGGNKDGAFFPRPDPGETNKQFGGYFGDKYFLRVAAGDAFEPNRSVPSPGIMGSLLTTNASGDLQPWQTLLFTPRPAAGNSHPGATSPPDHLYLDNFWMPVIDPYPISDPLSTAGKVNLNFQLMPFNHVHRTTALRGAMKPIMLSAVRDSLASGNLTYKHGEYDQPVNEQIRFPLNLDETMAEFSEVFSQGNFFRSATAVSETSFVPEGQSRSDLDSWWSTRRITSDTLREQPYTALLSRVTTKSNTFTVHFRVQALRQPPRPGRNWAEWDEGRDQVVGEYRGSTTIERFLDPNATDIPDYTQVNLSGNYQPIDRWYRWRVLSQKQFAP